MTTSAAALRRLHVHVIPTIGSWLKVIERSFRDLDAERLRRGVFLSFPKRIDAVMSYVDGHSDDPSPFIWSKTAEEIIEKVGRARRARVTRSLGSDPSPLEIRLKAVETRIALSGIRG